MTPREIIAKYFEMNLRPVFWNGDGKGPKETGWPLKATAPDDYHDGASTGLRTGHEVAPSRYVTDVDIDWASGYAIAAALLPQTNFAYGRATKWVSHCFYTTPEPLPSFKYEDVDGTCLIELRGTKTNGEIGMQSMAPPTVWSKTGSASS